ncbi:MAG: zinc-binding dehydrogenase [Streptosporangiaceae bacterium]
MTKAVVATAFGGPEVLALAEAAAAHRALATGHTRGKIVLVP